MFYLIINNYIQINPDSLGLNENINTEPLDQDKINETLSGINR